MSPEKPPEATASVLKVFAILQALAEQREDMALSDLSARLGIPKATLHRFLQTLRALGYVRQEPDTERYGLTMKLFELGTKALRHPDLVELAKQQMQLLSRETGETVHLGMRVDNEILYVHKLDSRHALGMYSRVGKRAPLHCTAIGKVLLAWAPDAERERLLGELTFRRYRPHTITSRKAFEQELKRTRERGFGVDDEEFDEHICCIGVPVFDAQGQAVAGLSISMPTLRFSEDTRRRQARLLRDASREVSQGLGCTTFPLDS